MPVKSMANAFWSSITVFFKRRQYDFGYRIEAAMREKYPRLYQNIPRRYYPPMPQEHSGLEFKCKRAGRRVSHLIAIPLMAWEWVHLLLLGTRVPHSGQENLGAEYLQWFGAFTLLIYGPCWIAVYTACRAVLAREYRAQVSYKAAIVTSLRWLFSCFPITAFFVFIMSYFLRESWGMVGDRPVGQYLFRLGAESIVAFCLATSVGYAVGKYARFRPNNFLNRMIDR